MRHGVPRSPRAGAAWSSGEEREMMTGRALVGSTRSTRATPSSLLTGNDVGRKMAGGYEKMQHRRSHNQRRGLICKQ